MPTERIKILILKLLAAAAVIFCAAAFLSVCRGAARDLQRFGTFHFDYTAMEKYYSETAVAGDVRALLPEDSRVEITHGPRDLAKVALRYYLYPITIAERADYVLDWDGRVTDLPPGWSKRVLAEGVPLYAKTNVRFRQATPGPRALSFPLILGYMSLHVIIMVVLGHVALTLMRAAVDDFGTAGYLGLCYLAGYLLTTLSVWLAMLVGMPLDRRLVLVIVAALMVVLTVWLRCRGPRPFFRRTGPGTPLRPDRVPARRAVLSAGLTAVLLFMVGAVFIQSISEPVVDWDALSHLVMKSKVFFRTGRLDFSVTHLNGYPLLWPLHVAGHLALLNGMHDYLAKWLSGIFFIVLVTQMNASLRLLDVPKIPRLGVLLFFLSFTAGQGTMSVLFFIAANAENILLAYLAGTLTAVLARMRPGRPCSVFLPVLMALGLSLSKLEGSVPVVLVAFILLTISRRGGIMPDGRREGLFLLLCVLAPVAWLWWVRFHGYGAAVPHLAEGLTPAKIFIWGRTLPEAVVTYKYALFIVLLFLWTSAYTFSDPWAPAEGFLFFLGVLLLGFSLTATLGETSSMMALRFRETFPRLFMLAAVPMTLVTGSRIFSRPLREEGPSGGQP